MPKFAKSLPSFGHISALTGSALYSHIIIIIDFPGSPVVKTLPSNAGGADSIPRRGAKIPHASRPKNQNTEQKQYCNKFNKDFKNGPHQKNL